MGKVKQLRDQNTILISRPGAFGDCIITTPAVKKLAEQGYKVIYYTTERGEEVLRHSPHIAKLIVKKKGEIPIDELDGYLKCLLDTYRCERLIDFTECIETQIAMHPRNPEYVYPKQDRYKICNKNYYEHTMEHAGLEFLDTELRPQLFFTDAEEEATRKLLRPNCFNIVWCLAGSGSNKAYPHCHQVWDWLTEEYDNIHIITVGDEKCKFLETLQHENITNLAGQVPMRTSMCLTKFASLIVSPDTGVLHAAGVFKTPKIGLLGHTNRENITKHFENDYSIESASPCAPCFRLIYHADIVCPRDEEWHACWCMLKIDHEELYNRIVCLYEKQMSNM